MKKHRITRKKKTLKKYSKARVNRKTIKMKGGGASEYIQYRERQLKRAKEIFSELGYNNHRQLKQKIERLIPLLDNHIKAVSKSNIEIWIDYVEAFDPLINIINGYIASNSNASSILPIPIQTNTQPSSDYIQPSSHYYSSINPNSENDPRLSKITASRSSRRSIYKTPSMSSRRKTPSMSSRRTTPSMRLRDI
uniref:Uncharacterized protein n=1 Tax=viral metagenome TaxID=1070528 RepID=A0A6C0D567_9ZZZZ